MNFKVLTIHYLIVNRTPLPTKLSGYHHFTHVSTSKATNHWHAENFTKSHSYIEEKGLALQMIKFIFYFKNERKPLHTHKPPKRCSKVTL